MPHATPPQGRLLGDFRIVGEIGRGGMGVVYEAVDGGGRRVAVKVLEAHLTLQRAAVDRFLREAHAASALRHDHIVAIERVGEEEGVHYFAMELVVGASLAELVAALSARGRGGTGAGEETLASLAERAPELLERFLARPFEESARAAAAIARALHHAHERGVLHRDVKPSNVLLRRDGTPLLIDFGLAREEGLPALTQTGDLVGSPCYVAPEQCGGGHARLDARVDVHGLGVALYELVTLRRPYDGECARDVLDRIAAGDAPSPRRLRPELPRALDAIVRRAMATRPADRYPSALELARDLERFLRGRPTRALALERRRALGRALRSRGARVAAVGLALFLAAFFLTRRVAERVAFARSFARLVLESDEDGVVVELFEGERAVGRPTHVVTLPQQEPLRVAPGRHALRVRAADHDERVLEGARALALAPGEARVASVWLPPLALRWVREVGPLAAAPRALDVDGRRELLLLLRDGSLARIDDAGGSRPFASVGSEPYLLATAPGARGGACVAVAVPAGLDGVVRGLDERGALVFERAVRGRVTALVASATKDGARRWIAGSDLGTVVALDEPEGGAPLADLGATILALAELPPLVALTGRALARIGGGGGTLGVVASASGAWSSSARLLAWSEDDPGSAALAVVDGGEASLFALDGAGAIARSGSRPLGDAEAVAVARAGDGSATLVVAAGRALRGIALDGSARFERTLERRIEDVVAADLDGDGADELALRLEGDAIGLLGSEPRVRWKQGSDVVAFTLLPPATLGAARLLLRERDGALVAVGADGRRLAQLRPGSAATAAAVDPGRRVWLGGEDGALRELVGSGGGLELRTVVPALHPPITALALGALGADGSPRLVTGDAAGAIGFRFADGRGDAAFTPRAGAAVIELAVGDLGGEPGDEAVVASSRGALLRFDPGTRPRAPLELGGECTALALVEGDGGAREIVVALAGGELRRIGSDGATRASLARPATARALLALPSTLRSRGLLLAGADDGGVDLFEDLDPDVSPRRLARLSEPVEELALFVPEEGGEPLVAARAGGRVAVVTLAGQALVTAPAMAERRSSPARACRLALVDLDGDGAAELLHLDERGRLAAREVPDPR
jgi:hypothetical protein